MSGGPAALRRLTSASERSELTLLSELLGEDALRESCPARPKQQEHPARLKQESSTRFQLVWKEPESTRRSQTHRGPKTFTQLTWRTEAPVR